MLGGLTAPLGEMVADWSPSSYYPTSKWGLWLLLLRSLGREQRVVRSSFFCLSAPVVYVLGTLLVVVVACPFFTLFEMIFFFLFLKYSNPKLIHFLNFINIFNDVHVSLLGGAIVSC